MLDLFQFADETAVGFDWVIPELGAVGDGWDDNCFVKEAEVGGRDAFDGVAKDFEAAGDSVSLFGKHVHMVGEGEFPV